MDEKTNIPGPEIRDVSRERSRITRERKKSRQRNASSLRRSELNPKKQKLKKQNVSVRVQHSNWPPLRSRQFLDKRFIVKEFFFLLIGVNRFPGHGHTVSMDPRSLTLLFF